MPVFGFCVSLDISVCVFEAHFAKGHIKLMRVLANFLRFKFKQMRLKLPLTAGAFLFFKSADSFRGGSPKCTRELRKVRFDVRYLRNRERLAF